MPGRRRLRGEGATWCRWEVCQRGNVMDRQHWMRRRGQRELETTVVSREYWHRMRGGAYVRDHQGRGDAAVPHPHLQAAEQALAGQGVRAGGGQCLPQQPQYVGRDSEHIVLGPPLNGVGHGPRPKHLASTSVGANRGVWRFRKIQEAKCPLYTSSSGGRTPRTVHAKG